MEDVVEEDILEESSDEFDSTHKSTMVANPFVESLCFDSIANEEDLSSSLSSYSSFTKLFIGMIAAAAFHKLFLVINATSTTTTEIESENQEVDEQVRKDDNIDTGFDAGFDADFNDYDEYDNHAAHPISNNITTPTKSFDNIPRSINVATPDHTLGLFNGMHVRVVPSVNGERTIITPVRRSRRVKAAKSAGLSKSGTIVESHIAHAIIQSFQKESVQQQNQQEEVEEGQNQDDVEEQLELQQPQQPQQPQQNLRRSKRVRNQ
jgi:hypothetical protein